jgi:glutamate---cysteine ligase / carboxylate-amine ligase
MNSFLMASGYASPMPEPTFTLGIEEEFQVVDPETRELKSHIHELFAEGEKRLKDEIKREMHDPVIEVGTPICKDIAHARREITRLRKEICTLVRESGLRIASAGTHPISHWSTVPITSNERYDRIVYELQMLARANLIFGLHVHVAVEDNETRLQIMNAARYFLPHIFALSVNSPFWCAQNTGWKSYRSKVFERFPRTGIPDYFRAWTDYEEYVATLVRTNCIDNPKKIWWDVRPHPFFPTLEYRICDVPMRVDETICFAALFQAVTVKLYRLYKQNMGWRLYRRSLLNENKQRAARFGCEGKLIDFGKREEVPFGMLLDELLEFVDDVVDELGSRNEVYYAREIMKHGTGADRQLRAYGGRNDLRDVVDYIVKETEHGIL